MDTEVAIDTRIEPQLIEALGQQTANAVLTRATLCYAAAIGSERQRFEAFVRSICTEACVVDAWGQQVAAEQEKRWKALIGFESDPKDGVRAKKETTT